MPQLLRRAVQQERSKYACIDINGKGYTYEETLLRVKKIAGAMVNSLQLTKNGRVSILSLNSHRYYELYFAIPWAGGLVVPLNIRLAPAEVYEILADSQTELLFVDTTFSSIIDKILQKPLDQLRHIIYWSDSIDENIKSAKGWYNYEQLLEGAKPLIKELCAGGDETYGIFYTGGTSGKAKGVMLTHGSIIINALGNLCSVKFGPDSVYLHCAPMFHLADAQMTFAGTMGCSSHVFLPKFDPVEVLECIDSKRITKIVVVPVMLQLCLSSSKIHEYSLISLDSIVYGGSPMPSILLEKALTFFPKVNFFQGYGMTECGPAISMLMPKYHTPNNPKLKSAGRVVPFAEVIVADDNGKEVPSGTVGEILVKGPHVMKGYWNMPRATEKVLAGGWMHTGDGGYIDNEGFIFICDRIKDMIITGGENVYSAEVEKVIQTYPGIAMAAVIGTPDEKFGEVVTAVVTLGSNLEKKTITLDNLKSYCKLHIAGYKCPKRLIIREKLPLSGAGKILKHKIRDEFWHNNESARVYSSKEKLSEYS